MLLIPLILIFIGVALLVYGGRAGRGSGGSGQYDDSHGVDVVWRVGRSDRKRRR